MSDLLDLSEDVAQDAPVPIVPPARRGLPRQRASRTPQESRGRRRRLLGYGLLAASTMLMVNALVGENGYLATLRAERETTSLVAEIARENYEKAQLEDQIRRLKTDPAAVEETARRTLNLIKPGETLIIIRDARPATPPSVPR